MQQTQLKFIRGREWGDPDAARIKSLNDLDVASLRQQSYVKDATPLITQSILLRLRSISAQANVSGVDANYFNISNLSIELGRSFYRDELMKQAQVVVIDEKTRELFFGKKNPIGQTLYIGKLPCIIVGLTGRNIFQEKWGGAKLSVWLPYTTAAAKLTGRSNLDSVIVALREGEVPLISEERLTELLSKRHKIKDFMVFNRADQIRTTIEFTRTITILLAAIGVISLSVGGIGVMNIMLVSVSERAREIGIRMAVGARQSDIRGQFIIEAFVVCLIGGLCEIILSYLICLFSVYLLPPRWEMNLSIPAIMIAILSASMTGLIFGYLPARNAARLDPVEALARD